MATVQMKAQKVYVESLETLTSLQLKEVNRIKDDIAKKRKPTFFRGVITEAQARKKLKIPDGEITYPLQLLDPVLYTLFLMSESMVCNGEYDKEITLTHYEYERLYALS